MDYDLEYSSAAFNRLIVSISPLNGAIFKVVDLTLTQPGKGRFALAYTSLDYLHGMLI